jgi:Zn-dependent metalloprotease
MQTIPQYLCGVIPEPMLSRVAAQQVHEARHDARATLEHMRELATGKARTLLAPSARPSHGQPPRYKFRNVYDARHSHTLPGTLVVNHHRPRSGDVEANEAYNGTGLTYDFFAFVFGRRSIDDRGMRLDATVHYGTRFENAMWNGRQMI